MLQGQDILWIQQLVRQVPTSQHMVDYAVDLVRATRPKEPPSPDFVKNWLAWGAGPRAAQYMILAAKARAILHGRFAVTADDIRAMAYPVLRHRIFTNFNADAEGVDVDQVIEKILADGARADLRRDRSPPRRGRREERRRRWRAHLLRPRPNADAYICPGAGPHSDVRSRPAPARCPGSRGVPTRAAEPVPGFARDAWHAAPRARSLRPPAIRCGAPARRPPRRRDATPDRPPAGPPPPPPPGPPRATPPGR